MSESEKAQVRAFFDALEELAEVESLHGPTSLDAAWARANVRHLRERAAAAWREGLVEQRAS